jgi:uncharacterized membrane protein
MIRGKSLKEQNAWLLRAALVVHACAFAYVVFDPLPLPEIEGAEFLRKVQALAAPGTIALALIALTKLVLLGLLPAPLRDVLIHWRYPHPLPGARAFTKIGPRDPRVNMDNLRINYGPLPTEPDKQDRLFYSIYKTHADEAGVLDAHKSYLAARDIGTITLILFVLLVPLAFWFVPDHRRVFIYGLALLVACALLCIAAQRYGTRLVQNSLAVASHSTVGRPRGPTKKSRKGASSATS